ncbi:uncharacterized protein LOC111261631 isoform X1 [Varroa jacobsoni]|uniref:uncharacterized protein LOC111261631 isoform X1 n=1 Tax=Varroa jacobsoni TaxID=62625 RepID=UPI000BF2F52A|nr:uncharacterized protein LOC111261631 isoform X1 [Varroa jacobsoni]
MFPYRRVNDAQRQYRIAAPVSNRLPFVPLGHASIADVLTLPLTVASLGLLFDAEVKFTLTFYRPKRRFACFALRQTIQSWLSHSFAARRSMTVPCKSLCGLVPAPDLTGFISWLRQARQSGKMTPDDVSTIVFLVAQQETRQIDGRFVVVIVRRMTLSKRTRGQEHLLGQHVA